MKEQIAKFIKLLTELTKEEADFIETVVKWDDEKRAAFMFAKKIFEEKDER